MTIWQTILIGSMVLLAFIIPAFQIRNAIFNDKTNKYHLRLLWILALGWAIVQLMIALATYKDISARLKKPAFGFSLNGIPIGMTYQVNEVPVVLTSHVTLPATDDRSVLSFAVKNRGEVPAEGVILTVTYCDSLRPIGWQGWHPVYLVGREYPVMQVQSNICLWASPQAPNIPPNEFWTPEPITIAFTNRRPTTYYHTIRIEVRDRNGVNAKADALLLFRTNITAASSTFMK